MFKSNRNIERDKIIYSNGAKCLNLIKKLLPTGRHRMCGGKYSGIEGSFWKN